MAIRSLIQFANLLLVVLLVLVLVPASAFAFSDPPGPQDSTQGKLDEGIEGAEDFVPIFVRAEDQLLPGLGAYERFCEEQPANARRRQLRDETIRTLQQKADRSFTRIQKQVEQLVADKQIRNLQRYWIVNGFACEATAEAAKTLSELESVGFVYRQRETAQHKTSPNGDDDQQQEQELVELYRDLLENYQDDTDLPFDASESEIPWNLKRVRADRVWAGLANEENNDAGDANAMGGDSEKGRGYTGRGVTVAVLDSGLMNVPEMRSAVWVNSDESLNGKDDDQNGYVDDVFGYDFELQSPFTVKPSFPSHGTLCAGIVVGRPLVRENKPAIVTGVAPRAKVMPLVGKGHLLAYEYALVNGADVLSMSYTWDAEDLGNYRGLFRTAHEHLAVAGVVSVGGAGNFGASHPEGKQIGSPKDIPCVIAVAGVYEDGEAAKASGRGPVSWAGVRYFDGDDGPEALSKPDVTACFGGYPMWTRMDVWKGQKLERLRVIATDEAGYVLVTGPRGNSFSGPHAAGLAALMLEADPDLPVWELKRLMESTCKEMGADGRDTVYGAGMLQADKAVQAVLSRKNQLPAR